MGGGERCEVVEELTVREHYPTITRTGTLLTAGYFIHPSSLCIVARDLSFSLHRAFLSRKQHAAHTIFLFQQHTHHHPNTKSDTKGDT
jgi:hypothetical protein